MGERHPRHGRRLRGPSSHHGHALDGRSKSHGPHRRLPVGHGLGGWMVDHAWLAVLAFGGWATESRSVTYQEKLATLLQQNNIDTQGGFMVAQFNSPYALPMFRKNELMVRILNAPNKESGL